MLNEYGTADVYAVGESRMYLLLGEPEMEILTGIPAVLAVSYEDSISTGNQSYAVVVKDAGGNALKNALVCVWKGSEVQDNQYTDFLGVASFSITPTTAGTMYLTVTLHNYTPFLAGVNVSKNSDLWIRDCLADNGTVPSNGNCPIWWQSTDMWIDNDKDGIQDAPVVGAANNLYVRPRNLGPANANNVTVDLYYRNNTTGLGYPTGATVIGSLSGLTIPSGGSTSGSVSWTVPQPPTTGGHYCIGAVVSTSYDPQTSNSPVWDNNVACVNIGYLYARAGTPGKEPVQPVLADFLLRNPFSDPETFILDAEVNLPSGWYVIFTDMLGTPISLPYYATLVPEEERLIKLAVYPKPDAQHGDNGMVIVKQYFEQGYPDNSAVVGGISFPVKVDLLPPSAITDLQVSQAGDNLLLEWTRVTTDINNNPEKIACYNIYRGDSPDFDPDLTNRIGRVAVDQDEAVAGFQWYDETSRSTWFYFVRVEDEAGYESDNSNLGYLTVEHTVSIPELWSGISSFIVPEDPDIEVMFEPIISKLIILYNLSGMYWPEIPVNTLGDWNTHSGYVIKVSEDAELVVPGYEVPNKTVALNPGWSLIPVLSRLPYNIETLFDGLAGFVVAKDVAGTGVYWKDYGINTIDFVLPGKAYYVRMNVAGSIDYSLPGDKASSYVPRNIPELITPWNVVSNTPISHLVAFNIAGNSFSSGDIIGGFTSAGWCAGLTGIDNPATPFALSLNGDDLYTPLTDGFESGEEIGYMLYRPSSGEIFDLEVTYNPEMNTGTFETNGLSEVNKMKMTLTGIAGQMNDRIRIYPNPNDGTFTLEGTEKAIHVTIYNAFGDRIYKDKLNPPAKVDLSTQPRGIYFIRIESDNQVFFEKLIIN